MSVGFFPAWRSSFLQLVQEPETAAPLKEASLAGQLRDWTASFEVPVDRDQAQAKADETRSGLKELGLDDNLTIDQAQSRRRTGGLNAVACPRYGPRCFSRAGHFAFHGGCA